MIPRSTGRFHDLENRIDRALGRRVSIFRDIAQRRGLVMAYLIAIAALPSMLVVLTASSLGIKRWMPSTRN